MASKRVNFNKRCFFVLSGVSNSLSKTLAIEMCRHFGPGSVAMLIESSDEDLQEVKKEIGYLEKDIEVITCCLHDWKKADAQLFHEMLTTTLKNCDAESFDLAFILHNEGTDATERLMEPDTTEKWLQYVHKQLYAAVALNQEFLKLSKFAGIEKLVVNMTSSLFVKPFIKNGMLCSCLKARNMYFHAMAAEEHRNGVAVLCYSPGILESHKPEFDLNNNMVDLLDLQPEAKMLKLPRVKAEQSTLKLINILQDLSFISGHDVDYYDTFVL